MSFSTSKQLTARDAFHWHQFDINHFLPAGWQNDIRRIAENFAVLKNLSPTSVTSRELNKNLTIPTLTVDGVTVKKELPWLFNLYLTLFRDLGQMCIPEQLFCADNPLYAINLNIQKGPLMRYECHVDSNPLQCVFYATTHLPGEGGELVVSTNSNALGPEEIDKNCATLYPTSGNILFFDATHAPHYVRPLQGDNSIRISVPMNFYTATSPETARPTDLNNHLFSNKY